MKTEARLYEKLDNKFIHCYLCSHHCRLADKKFGFCGVRQNIGGNLYTYAYGKLVAANIDPIEKKPLYHFLPGSFSFSVATIGCNFRCGFCQNWQISQASFKEQGLSPKGSVPEFSGEEFLPEKVVEVALNNNCRSISYTYTEPTIFFEYAFDSAKIAKAKGLYNVFVTNGYMSKECVEEIRPYLDAANIDLKFFNDDSYKKTCSGALAPVLDSIRLMHEYGIWVEVTTLLIPGANDSEQEIRSIAEFISGIDQNIPWHISRFHPDYKFTDRFPTAEITLRKALEIGRESGLNYIYAGNVSGFGNDTECTGCKKILIKRDGFKTLEYNVENGKCRFCNNPIPGVF